MNPAPPRTLPGTGTLLAMRGVGKRFGGVTALQDVSLEVAERQVLGVIGPNGAGKTTLFNVACGFVRPDDGTLTWRGEETTRWRPHHLASHRIARTLQGLGLFDRMSVLDNVMVGAEPHAGTGFLTGLLGLPGGRREETRLRTRALEALDELGVVAYADRLPPSLPYAVRKKVALARALVAEPELLLLDEPASGLSSDEMSELGSLVRGLTDRMAVMLVEHHMELVMSVCDDIVVLDFGRVISRGTPQHVREDPAVVAAYLGEVVEDTPAGAHDGPGRAGEGS